MNFFKGDVNQVYVELIHKIQSDGTVQTARGGGVSTIELHPAIIELEAPQQKLVTSYGRPVNVAFSLAEVIWILNGMRDVENLEFYNSKIKDFSDDGLVFNAPYGARLRYDHGHDQIEDVVTLLQQEPDSRQAILTIWHPNDRAYKLYSPKMEPKEWFRKDSEGNYYGRRITKDRACNVMAHLMIRKRKLDWLHVVRSNDAVLGVPYNWMQFLHLQNYIACRLNVEQGRFIYIADSMHAYTDTYYNASEFENVKHFDLYDHFPGAGMGMVAGDKTHIELQFQADIIRLAPNAEDVKITSSLGRYWENVLAVMLAHRFYREGKNQQCLELLGESGLYGAAQARFYWGRRWHKGDKEMEIAIDKMYGPEVGSWIQYIAS